MTAGAAQATGRAEPARSAGPPGAGTVDRGMLAVAAGEAIAALNGSASGPGVPAVPAGPAGPAGPGEPGGPGANGGGTPGTGTAGSGPAGNAGQPGSESAADGGLAAISASEARALIELVAARGIAQGQLGGLLGLEKSTVSRLAAGLERKGWIRRGRDEDNQRYIRLYLTPEGRAVAARVLNAWQSRQARILAALSADERAGLEAGLRGLVRGLAAEGIIGDPAASGDAR
jgi:DNA-binding MarR family transcriptional regulator